MLTLTIWLILDSLLVFQNNNVLIDVDYCCVSLLLQNFVKQSGENTFHTLVSFRLIYFWLVQFLSASALDQVMHNHASLN